MSKINENFYTLFPDYEITIGIEVHVQLNTNSKAFCRALNKKNESSNVNIDPICVGYPGTLPIINKKMIEYAIMAGLATNCKINQITEFDRKHYIYPDLPKGYQITQNESPICKNGFIVIIDENKSEKKIRINRIHMEEDAGKNIHSSNNESLVDYNRAGSPLLEIVSEADINSAFQARAYVKELHKIVTTIGICSGNLEDGVFRADINISVKKKDAIKFGTKCELKNINSFKFIFDAIEYESSRQAKILLSGDKIIQQTRLWDTKEKQTYLMREKEDSCGYRYFPEPDLPIIKITNEEIQKIKSLLPELPIEKRERFKKEYNLQDQEIEIILDDQFLEELIEKCFKLYPSKTIFNFIFRDFICFLKENSLSIKDINFNFKDLSELILMIDKKEISSKNAIFAFSKTYSNGNLLSFINSNNLKNNFLTENEIDLKINNILINYKKEVDEYRSGKTKMLGFLIGQSLKEFQGKADPEMVSSLIKKKIE